MRHQRVVTFFTICLLVLAQFAPVSLGLALPAPLGGRGAALAAPAAGHWPAAAQTWSIAISDAGFAPATLTISAGEQVEWHNTTGQAQTLRSGTPTLAAPHSVYLPFAARSGGNPPGAAAPAAPSAASADEFEVTLAPDEVYAHTFASAGEHPFYLADSPAHTGRIVVQAPPTSVPPTSVPPTSVPPTSVPPTPVPPTPDPGLPSDPSAVAPPLDPSVPASLADATAFLYTGSDPIQTGVVSGTIEPRRAAVLRGTVLDRAGQPLPGAAISILDHPEFGQTLSRADGRFDLAVNGGGMLTANYEKAGYLPAQRQVSAPWHDYAWLPDVVLIPPDPNVTVIDLSASTPMQVARGSLISDMRGSRQATLLFPQGTQAEMVLPNGLTQTLTTLTVRATEYTVGESGPQAMPAALPANSGFTYAAEFSVDEALAAGAIEVRFDRPVIAYLENFIGFPTGVLVPAGYYDRRKGQWLGMPNGLVVKVLSTAGGQASLDIDGDDLADPAAALADLGISSAELQRLAALYQPGQSLWRVPLTHFTPCDFNWPIAPPPDADYPPAPAPLPDQDHSPDKEDDCQETGSIIGCLSQTLGEAVDVTGTPFRLHYQSDRVPGRTAVRNLAIPLTGASVPASLLGIRFQAQVGGQTIEVDLPPEPNQTFRYAWDGRDGYGRTVPGFQAVTARLEYSYAWAYISTRAEQYAAFAGSPIFARNAGEVPGAGQAYFRTVVPGVPIALSTVWYGARQVAETVGAGGWDVRGQGLGGWTLNVHHVYDPEAGILYYGDGRQRSAQSVNLVIKTVAGAPEEGEPCDDVPASQVDLSSPGAVAVGPDGSYYVAESDGHLICRVGPDGTATTIAGTGVPGFSGDGGPATQAQLNYPSGLALAPDGSLYIADSGNYRVRRVTPDGLISTVAGTGDMGDGGDGGPATLAQLTPLDVAVGPDGHLYITSNHRVRRVAPDGYITTLAGTGVSGYSGDGGPAIQAELNGPWSVAVDAIGMIYIADTQNHRVRRVAPDGTISTVAGSGVSGFGGDGGPATLAQLSAPTGIALGPDGSLYIADTDNHRVRRVRPDGTITTLAGTGSCCFFGDNGPATQAQLGTILDLAISPDGSLYLADAYEGNIRRVALPIPNFGEDLIIPSEDGTQVFQFDARGRHLRTLHALTGAVRYQFAYDSAGRLAEVHDGDGNVTTIIRDAAGHPTQLVGPDGHTTALTLDANGYLASITQPIGAVAQFVYTADGLLTRMTDPEGGVYQFAYDAWGRLIRDQDPAGGVKTLALVESTSGYTVTLTTALSRTTTYEVQHLPTGVNRRIITDPAGARTEIDYNPDGSRVIRRPDGTREQVVFAPDPRWGMLAPVVQALTRTLPSGAQESVTGQRTAVLTNPYDPLSLVSQTDAVTINGQTTTSTYVAATRTVTHTGPGGSQRTIVLDDQGRVIRVEAAGLDPVVYTYDSRGRLSEEGQGGSVWRYAYPSPTQLTVTDPADHVTAYTYDAAGRLSGLVLPGGASYGFATDANGNRSGLTLPNGEVHSLSYTPVNLTAGYAPPGDDSYAWAYNPDRQRSLVTLPGGRTIESLFDSGGRPAGLAYPEAEVSFTYAGSTPGVSQISRTPTGGGAGQTLEYVYDGYRLSGAGWSGIATGQFQYTYQADGALSGLALSSGGDDVALGLTYDDDGFLTGYGPFTLVRGGPAGAVSEIQDAALSLAFSYDSQGRLTARTQRVAGSQRYQAQYTYTLNSQITQTLESAAGTPVGLRYSYDAAGRLTAVHRDGALAEQYTYDANGNRTSRLVNGATETAVYDPQGRLAQRGSVVYGFNADGFLASRGSDSFQYSARGELLQATIGGQTITYAYDGLGRRVGRTDSAGTTQYLYGNPKDVFQVTALRDPAGVLTFFYYDEAGLLIALRRGGATYYVATDLVGTPRVVSDASGAVIKTIAYDSFGVVLADSNPAFDLPFGFAGGLADPATGLVRIGLRDYEPQAGRWTARDAALFQANQANLYVYTGNDPVNRRDVGGLISVSASAYALVGLGVKLSVTRQGLSFCWEGGVGAGADVELDPFGGLDSDGWKAGAEVEANLGPLSAKKAVKYDDCGRSSETQGCIGPFCSDGSGLSVKGGPDDLMEPVKDMFKWGRAGLQAKAAFGYCMGTQW